MRLLALFLATSLFAAEHKIKPGDDPQAVMDAAAPGDKLTFLPGLHQHGLKKHRSILYVDKSVEIELMAGATLKLADGCLPQGKRRRDHDRPGFGQEDR
jgi:hypothetical protein